MTVKKADDRINTAMNTMNTGGTLIRGYWIEARWLWLIPVRRFVLYQWNGVNHGKARWFHPNGRRHITGSFNNGLRHGEWKVFDIRGQLRGVCNFKEDVQHGLWIEHDEVGIVVSRGEYRNGEKHGGWHERVGANNMVIHYENGKPSAQRVQ